MTTRVHTVAPGDSLRSIAQHYFGQADSWPVIQRANKLATEDVFVGEELVIPEISAAPPPVEPVIDPASIPMSMREREAMKRGEFQPGAHAKPPAQKESLFWRVMAWVLGIGITALIGLALLVRFAPEDNRNYMDKAKESCARQYTSEVAINDCALRLGAEKLRQIERDKMDAARSGVR